MSPEQARGDSSKVTPQSDIYSLGVILYELLVGRTPFQGDAQQLIFKVQSEEVPDIRDVNSSIPDALAHICHRALKLDPSRRYETAAEFGTNLTRWLNNEPITDSNLPMTVSSLIGCINGDGCSRSRSSLAFYRYCGARLISWRRMIRDSPRRIRSYHPSPTRFPFRHRPPWNDGWLVYRTRYQISRLCSTKLRSFLPI